MIARANSVVRATPDELDLDRAGHPGIECGPAAGEHQNAFTEISQNDNKALGFDWYLGNLLMGGGKIGVKAVRLPTYGGAPSAANPFGSFPGQTITDLAGNVVSDTTLPTSLTDGC